MLLGTSMPLGRIWPGSAESWNQWDLGTSMVAPCHGQDLFPSRLSHKEQVLVHTLQ
ncbi:unnamed protein product [Durusdinium trenchii]|uniref:Uncharacterized protein n=1 Tax=Durusdinium trenchii TaxID=1381693 RepID=A0ABP0M6B1_9DINO